MFQVSLKVIGGKHAGQVIPLTGHKFLIGRESDCNLRPNSEMVSRHHCAISVDDFSARVRDLGSTNGTLVNGERIRGVVTLKQGDHIKVGNLEFEVFTGSAAQTATAVLPAPTVLQAETAELSSEETHYDMPAIREPAAGGDPTRTIVIPSGEPVAPPPPAPLVQPPAPQPPPEYQYPQYPQPMGYPYPMGYPPMGGYYPPYPQYPYPQPVTMAQPYPPQQAPAPPSAAPGSEDSSQEIQQVRLPDPRSTGARDEQSASAAKQSGEKNPSELAADIIRQHVHRRPTVDE